MQKQQQIPFRNDRKKSKGKCRSNSRFPSGMTERKARANAEATADSLQELQKEKQGQMQKQQQIPFRNDRKKSKGKCRRRSGFPAGMTERKARARAKVRALDELPGSPYPPKSLRKKLPRRLKKPGFWAGIAGWAAAGTGTGLVAATVAAGSGFASVGAAGGLPE